MNDQPVNIERPLEPKKRAIVVGASSGMGAALLRALVVDGYHAAALARREATLHELCNEVNAQAQRSQTGAGRAYPYVHNVTNTEEVPALFQQIVHDLGGLDLLVYNAGVMPPVDLHEYNFEKDASMIQVNLVGAIAWLNQAASRFERTKKGHIVGISSVAGDRGRILSPVYNTSKAAFTTYLEALRNRLTRYGVTVTTIKPGQVETAMLEHVKKRLWVISPEDAAADMLKVIKAKKQTVYVPRRWGPFMLIIRHIPSFIFRRLSL
ncbi:MAG: SDR family NAD(P)-dependent oxidoreductase [Candidatus Promineifilaceae bacterium]|nr:SDR family NAD(P)-dependent oxidoreductase [Chloroflexota bacterium]